MRLCQIFALLLALTTLRAADDYQPGPDSTLQAGIAQGELIKGQYTAKDRSEFPGTERDYTIYLPPGLDKSKPAPFMVFQDGVLYQAPTVFDNLIDKKEIPPLIGIFIKPGVVPAANPNALPRFNRSYEYDSVTDAYARFLIEEFLPAVSQRHSLNLSTDPNDAAITGNSSGGICAFMVAWHRPDRFRRVFTGVGTYVGIHGADHLPVLIRKMEPKPLRVYLQSGTHDNDLYCGDWWMANQTMERALTWAGYEVNHTWGEGGHNQKHATAIFPDVLRWLWKGWPEPEHKEVKVNPRGDSNWKGYEVMGEGGWKAVFTVVPQKNLFGGIHSLASNVQGTVFAGNLWGDEIYRIDDGWRSDTFTTGVGRICAMAIDPEGNLFVGGRHTGLVKLGPDGKIVSTERMVTGAIAISHRGDFLIGCFTEILKRGKDGEFEQGLPSLEPKDKPEPPFPGAVGHTIVPAAGVLGRGVREGHPPRALAFSPDQSLVYMSLESTPAVASFQINSDGSLGNGQGFYSLEPLMSLDTPFEDSGGLCVDTEGRLYVATSLGIQVCDQAGRVNFIISTPTRPYDVCFGGKDLGELFIACGDKIYKRLMKVHGIVSGQMAPIKPKAPHL